jgi:predicted DCC family thiol-disulfide oxidoreductase YuxK
MKPWYLIYDDKCSICNIGVDKIKRLDKSRLIELVPLSNPKLPVGYEVPPKEEMQEQMHLISPDQKVYKGADAVARVAEIFPESKFAGKLISFPLVRPFARVIYDLIARNRLKFSKIVL